MAQTTQTTQTTQTAQTAATDTDALPPPARRRRLARALAWLFVSALLIAIVAWRAASLARERALDNLRAIDAEAMTLVVSNLRGELENLETRMTWTPTNHWRLFLSYSHNDIELPEGDFTLRLAQVGVDLIFSNKLSWVNLFQYDNDSETIGVNSRLHWIPQAGREAFVVLNHGLQDLDRNDSFHSANADLSLKFSYTLRF